ncbi:uncharacterized protein LOC131043614 isoform X2 [Cryptomeria japonica]|uniref:uncharacterized protein LOC131043614 isoform X2 n=1 Tax=Cryptomeria japonica TaxID=3369 RepID=UPI0027D9EA13|nr:uncharacterized protein LOC131043614 isoform X2 [Cryptomeria japonica]
MQNAASVPSYARESWTKRFRASDYCIESCRLFSPVATTSDLKNSNYLLESNTSDRSRISDGFCDGNSSDAKMLSFERHGHQMFQPYSQASYEKSDNLLYANILPSLNEGAVAWSTPSYCNISEAPSHCTPNGFRQGLEAAKYDVEKAELNVKLPSQESEVCYTIAQAAAVAVCDGDQRQSFPEDFLTAGCSLKMEEMARLNGISVETASTNPSFQWSNVVSFPAEGSAAGASNIHFPQAFTRHRNEGEDSPPTEQKRTSSALLESDQGSPSKRIRTSDAPLKVQGRKESLGERITALQQLVSPFGKTDTASVLLEATGYIKFLQDQVQVLSTPYLKGFTSGQTQLLQEGNAGDSEISELRRRGLCVVPVSYTRLVANNNGADFWASGIGGGTRF